MLDRAASEDLGANSGLVWAVCVSGTMVEGSTSSCIAGNLVCNRASSTKPRQAYCPVTARNVDPPHQLSPPLLLFGLSVEGSSGSGNSYLVVCQGLDGLDGLDAGPRSMSTVIRCGWALILCAWCEGLKAEPHHPFDLFPVNLPSDVSTTIVFSLIIIATRAPP